VDWNEKLFGWEDQVRLALLAKKLSDIGANVLVTNADHADVRSLYVDFGYVQLSRFSSLAADSSKRKPTTEAAFFRGPFYSTGAVETGLLKSFSRSEFPLRNEEILV
jgi:DNA adenine methylase